MSEISRFCKLLEEEGFQLKYEKKEHLEQFAYVNMQPAYCFPKYSAKPIFWKDVSIYVTGCETRKEYEQDTSSLFCGGHYKFMRMFVSGKEEDCNMKGSIPHADDLVNPPERKKKTTLEELEERAEKRRKLNSAK